MNQVEHSPTDCEELISAEEICQLFGCTDSSLVAMLRTGDLPGVKLGRDWRIPREAFWYRVNEMALERASDRRKAVARLDGPPASTEPVQAAYPRPRGRPRLSYGD